MVPTKLTRDLRLFQSYETGVHAGGIYTIASIVEWRKPAKSGMEPPLASV
jgi:hypothetical protein